MGIRKDESKMVLHFRGRIFSGKLVSLLSGIYPLPAMDSLLATLYVMKYILTTYYYLDSPSGLPLFEPLSSVFLSHGTDVHDAT